MSAANLEKPYPRESKAWIRQSRLRVTPRTVIDRTFRYSVFTPEQRQDYTCLQNS